LQAPCRVPVVGTRHARLDSMKAAYRHGLIACLVGAASAFVAALAVVGFRVLEVFSRTLGLFHGDSGSPIPGPDLAGALLALAAALLLAGAVALAVAGRRAALALERASLIELP
jgi:hypothetical protein